MKQISCRVAWCGRLLSVRRHNLNFFLRVKTTNHNLTGFKNGFYRELRDERRRGREIIEVFAAFLAFLEILSTTVCSILLFELGHNEMNFIV